MAEWTLEFISWRTVWPELPNSMRNVFTGNVLFVWCACRGSGAATFFEPRIQSRAKMFRSEVLEKSQDRLSGNVSIAIPMSWTAISYLFLAALVVTAIFLSFASYSRIERAVGSITTDKGISEIPPSRPGVVVELRVSEGDSVEEGDLLAVIRTEEDSDEALSSAAQIEQAIAMQDRSLEVQIAADNAAAAAQLSQLSAQQSGIEAEVEQINSQIALQRTLVDKAREDLDRALEVAERGFISDRDLQIREEALVAHQQRLSQLNQTLVAKSTALIAAQRSTAQISAQARANEANLTAARSQIGQQAAGAAGARAYALRAPIGGTVTALTVHIGQTVGTEAPIMAILPKGSELQAQLIVPSSAIGFVKEGQEVNLAIDAFPYQRFGTVSGEVVTVAESALSQQSPNGEAISVYPVRVKLDSHEISAFGRSEKLVAGMTLSARIVAENQSLIEWLFEPLFAVQRR